MSTPVLRMNVGVADGHALVDDPAVEARQVQRGERGHQLEGEEHPQHRGVRREVGADESVQHQWDLLVPSRTTETISAGVRDGPGKNGWTLESVRCDSTSTTSWAGSRSAAASSPMSSTKSASTAGSEPRWGLWCGAVGRQGAGRAQRRHHPDDPLDPDLHDGHRGHEALVEGERAVDAAELVEHVRGVEHRCGTGLDELLLAAERPEHGALGDAGRLGHLTRREAGSVLAQQGDGHLDERGAAVLGAQGGGTWGHPDTVSE